MTHSLPQYIHPISLCKQKARLSGDLSLDHLTRLSPLVLESSQKSIYYDLQFAYDHKQIPYLKGYLKTYLTLKCGRCLENFEYPMKISIHLIPILKQADTEGLSDEHEPLLLENDSISLVDLIEDELLLAFPFAPKHEDMNCANHAAST